MGNKLERGILFFCGMVFAIPSWLCWSNALGGQWPEDINGWLGLVMFPGFSIAAFLYAIFYRRVKRFDDGLQHDMDNNTRRGKLVFAIILSLMLIFPAIGAVGSHIVEHEPVQTWEFFVYGFIFIVWAVSMTLNATDSWGRLTAKPRGYLERKGILKKAFNGNIELPHNTVRTYTTAFVEWAHGVLLIAVELLFLYGLITSDTIPSKVLFTIVLFMMPVDCWLAIRAFRNMVVVTPWKLIVGRAERKVDVIKWEDAGQVDFKWSQIKKMRKERSSCGLFEYGTYRYDIEIEIFNGPCYRFRATGFARHHLLRDLKEYHKQYSKHK